MKNILIILAFCVSFIGYGQINDNGSVDGPMTTAEIQATVTTLVGLTIYSTDTNTDWQWDGSAWIDTGSGGGGTTYTAGNGLNLTGPEFSVDTGDAIFGQWDKDSSDDVKLTGQQTVLGVKVFEGVHLADTGTDVANFGDGSTLLGGGVSPGGQGATSQQTTMIRPDESDDNRSVLNFQMKDSVDVAYINQLTATYNDILYNEVSLLGSGTDDQTLAEVLAEGNSAGVNTLDMNSQDIINVDNIQSTGINVQNGGVTNIRRLEFSVTDTEPSIAKGKLYFDDSENTLKQYNGTSWEALNGGSGTDDQTIDKFALNGTTLELSLEGDGEADKTVNLGSIPGYLKDDGSVSMDDELNMDDNDIANIGTVQAAIVTVADALKIPVKSTGSAYAGSIYLDSDDNKVYIHDGTNMVDLTASGSSTDDQEADEVPFDGATATYPTVTRDGWLKLAATNVEEGLTELHEKKFDSIYTALGGTAIGIQSSGASGHGYFIPVEIMNITTTNFDGFFGVNDSTYIKAFEKLDDDLPLKASTAEAEAGTDDSKYMTALKVKESIDENAGASATAPSYNLISTAVTLSSSHSNNKVNLISTSDPLILNNTFPVGKSVQLVGNTVTDTINIAVADGLLLRGRATNMAIDNTMSIDSLKITDGERISIEKVADTKFELYGVFDAELATPDIPTIVATETSNTNATTTTITVDKPTGTGNLLVLAVAARYTNNNVVFDNTTKPTGFTLHKTDGSSTPDVYGAIYYKVVDDTEGSDFTLTSAFAAKMTATAILIDGADESDPMGIIGASSLVQNVTSSDVPGITTTVDNSLIIALGILDGNITSTTSGTGYTELVDIANTNHVLTIGTKDQVTAGATGDVTFTPSASVGITSWQFSINPE